MAHVRAYAETIVDVPPAAVYAVLADYTTHHPRIMPSPPFSYLRVEEGGVGAGTVFRIDLRVLGRRQTLHMRVAEPEPGRVLTETNLDTGAVTTFTVDGRGPRTLVRLASEWEAASLVDRLATPLVTRRLFVRQLRKLDSYARTLNARP